MDRPTFAHRTLVAAAIVALFAALAACGDGSQSGECGPKGEKTSVGNTSYCIYDAQSGITETGFDCPNAYPNRHSAGDVTVCSKDEKLPDDHQETIRDQYESGSGADVTSEDGDSSDAAPGDRVGQNASFTDCKETPSGQEYCAAERLEWSYASEESVVSFDHTRVVMNCVGDRSIEAYELEDGTYRIREIDAPGDRGRAACKCSFNYGIDIPDVSGQIDVELVRETTDAPDGEKVQDVWSGTIDLTAGSDAIVITDDSTMWCSK